MSDMLTIDQDDRLLVRTWESASSALGADEMWTPVRRAVFRCYEEPHRHYHTVRHLYECLAAFEAAASLAERPAEVVMALWFHDAMYNPMRHDNEDRSAAMALATLMRVGVTQAAASRVADLVRATSHAAVPPPGDATLVADIDLGILAAPRERFIGYEREVRAEYADVPEAIFWAKRTGILRSLLARPFIYGTPVLRERLEAQARANLAWSIEEASRLHVVTQERAEAEGFVLGGIAVAGEEIRSGRMDRASVLLVRGADVGSDKCEFKIFVKPERLGEEFWAEMGNWLAPDLRPAGGNAASESVRPSRVGGGDGRRGRR